MVMATDLHVLRAHSVGSNRGTSANVGTACLWLSLRLSRRFCAQIGHVAYIHTLGPKIYTSAAYCKQRAQPKPKPKSKA